jgi:chorismate mutase
MEREMPVSAVRGATVARENSQQAIWDATEELLLALIAQNEIEKDEVVAAFFTMTPDLDAAFPAYAARRLGWTDVPLLGAVETPVPGTPGRMIRILVEIERPQRVKLRPVYLGETLSLRPDLAPPG